MDFSNLLMINVNLTDSLPSSLQGSSAGRAGGC